VSRRWAFLDVGNVLLDEDPLTYRVFRLHVEAVRLVRPEVREADLLALREARDAAGAPWPLFEVVSSFLDEPRVGAAWAAADGEVRAHYAELSPPIPGAAELVDRLRRRFRLGLIANQPRECRAHLAALGLLGRFEVVALSEEVGLFKPDPALFRLALDRAGVAAGDALMIGDRLDHDIAPAAALGMATAWVRWPRRDAMGWRPDDPEALAYRRSLERSASHRRAHWRHVRPSVAVDAITDLDAALCAWPMISPEGV
jgi:5'-nucleotidase